MGRPFKTRIALGKKANATVDTRDENDCGVLIDGKINLVAETKTTEKPENLVRSALNILIFIAACAKLLTQEFCFDFERVADSSEKIEFLYIS